MEEVTELGLMGYEALWGWLLQPCRLTHGAQERWWDIQLKANTDTSIRGWHQHPATEGVTWRHPKPLLEMLINGGTGYLRSWSRQQFKWQEGKTK